MRAPSCRVIQITPALPPNIGGVSDYAGILGDRLEGCSAGAAQVRYVCAGRARGVPPGAGYDAVDLAGECNWNRLVTALRGQTVGSPGRCAVLVNYVGYGYALNGAPSWLLTALRAFRRACPSVDVITIFHELYATSRKPWERPFWTAPLQWRIARGFADLSDRLFTSTGSAAGRLQAWRGAEVQVQPVFSTVGEPDANPRYASREPVAVLFGSAGKKRRAYRSLTPERANRLADLGIEYMVDVGPAVENVPRAIGPLRVEKIGVAPREVVSALLLRSAVGLYILPSHLLAKSTILAAYFAHGLPSVNFAPPGETEGLLEVDQLLFYERFIEEVRSLEALASISDRAWNRYQARGHSRNMAAAVLAELNL